MTMSRFLDALARFLGRRNPGDHPARKTYADISIREGNKVLSGQDLYRDVAAVNEADAAADLKAFHERIDRNMPGGPG